MYKLAASIVIILSLISVSCKTHQYSIESEENSISVKSFNAKGNGETDDTDAFKKALSFLKNKSIQVKTESSTIAGTGTMYIPSGIYIISSTLDLTGLNGLQIIGNGKANTILLYKNEMGQLFYAGQNINLSIKDLSFENGTIKKLPNNKYEIKNFSSGTATAFLWTGQGSNRFLSFKNIGCNSRFNVVWQFEGNGTHSETTFINCTVLGANNVFLFNNQQSVNHTFYNCSFERNTGKIFFIKAGGYINMYGGSVILFDDLFYFEPVQSGIGQYNNFYSINTVRIEMSNNRSKNPINPMIVNCTQPVNGQIVINSCSNNTDSDINKVYFKPMGDLKIAFNNSNIKGTIDLAKSNKANISINGGIANINYITDKSKN